MVVNLEEENACLRRELEIAKAGWRTQARVRNKQLAASRARVRALEKAITECADTLDGFVEPLRVDGYDADQIQAFAATVRYLLGEPQAPGWNSEYILEKIAAATEIYGSFSIEWNEHRSGCSTVEEEIREWPDSYAFENAAERARSIAQNTMVRLQWYRRTSVSFYVFAAPDLASLFAWMNRFLDEERDAPPLLPNPRQITPPEGKNDA